MAIPTKIPFYAKASLIFIGLFAFISMLYIGQHIIVPVIFSTMIAIVLSPVVGFFVRKKMNRVLAITITLVLVFLVSGLFVLVLWSQVSIFTESFPKLLDKLDETVNRSVLWVSTNFNISSESANKFIADTKAGILTSSQSSIGTTISSMGNALIVIFLIPVYVFMILFYQPLLLDFIRKLFGKNNNDNVNEVLSSIKTIIQRYLVAILIEAAIIATLQAVGLLFIGIDYAILFGIIGGLLNVIPYIGGILAVSLPMTVAIATKSSYIYPLLVLGLYMVIQFIDNHYILPKLVASKVKVNALISVIVMIAGGMLWGIPGMIMSIPLTAILKVIFDHIDALKPWGLLLGDTMPVMAIFKIKLPKKIINIKTI